MNRMKRRTDQPLFRAQGTGSPNDSLFVRTGRRVGAALVLLGALAGCADGESSPPSAPSSDLPPAAKIDGTLAGDPHACTRVDTPMLDVPTASATEPRIRVPQPPGWQGGVERYEKSEAIRFALRDTNLTDDWQNAAVISLEPVPDLDVQTLLDRELARQVKFFDEGERASMTTTRTTVCGLTAQKTTRLNAKTGLVTSLDVVTKTGDQAYIAGISVATKEDNAIYRGDAETIVAGFQVLPPDTL